MVMSIRLLSGLLVAVASAVMLSLSGAAAQDASCDDYSSQEAAQFAMQLNPGLAASLDPDGNGTACDHDSGSRASDLQLPEDPQEAPTAAPTLSAPASATIDVVDQQPADTITLPASSPLDGLLGSSREAFEGIYGQPLDEISLEEDSPITSFVYAGPPTADDLFVIYDNDMVVVLYIGGAPTWDGAGVVNVIRPFLPSDISELPELDMVDDVTYMLSLHSTEYEHPVIEELMTRGNAAGEVGDFYIMLHTEDGENVYDIEFGLGNGDNVRESHLAETLPDAPPLLDPTAEPVATEAAVVPTQASSIDADTFLSEARAEIQRIELELLEMQTIIDTGTFTDQEIDRLSTILVDWVNFDTSLPDAPPEHAQLAQDLQQIRLDVSSIGMSLVTVITDPDNADPQAVATSIETLQTRLDAMDQQLAALGF